MHDYDTVLIARKRFSICFSRSILLVDGRMELCHVDVERSTIWISRQVPEPLRAYVAANAVSEAWERLTRPVPVIGVA